MNTTHKIAVALIAIAGLNAIASADTLDMKYTGKGKGTNVKITQDTNTFNTFAGQLKHTIQGASGIYAPLNGERITFCSDVYETVTSTFKAYDIVGLNLLPDTAPMGAAKADAIWNMYQAQGSSAFASGASNDLAAAFQIAVWEIVSDFDSNVGLSSLNVNSGAFKAKKTDGGALSGGIATNLASLFAVAAGGFQAEPSLSLIGLRHATAQDQIVAYSGVIPAPGAGALAGLGLLCMGRRKRSSK